MAKQSRLLRHPTPKASDGRPSRGSTGSTPKFGDVRPTSGNYHKLRQAFAAFGLPTDAISEEADIFDFRAFGLGPIKTAFTLKHLENP